VLDCFVVCAGVDRKRLHGLRYFPHQVDLQKSAFERGALHLDIVGEVEDAAERACRDALVEVLMLAFLCFTPLNGEYVLLCRDGDLLRREARLLYGG